MSAHHAGRDFVVTGLKSDYNTSLALPFATKVSTDKDDGTDHEKDELRAMEASAKLRTIYEKHIHPTIMSYFGTLFRLALRHALS